MVYTITMNPCLDRHLEVAKLIPDDTLRAISEARYAAGKGIDVSVVLRVLGCDSIALGFVGGFDGLELEGRLINRGVQCDFTQTSGETRTNIHIYDRSTGTRTSISVAGAEIKPAELGTFCRRVRNLKPAPDYVALCGSIPRGVSKNIYHQVGMWLKDQGARVILDADGEAFVEGLKAEPYLVKPNIHEMGRYLKEELEGRPLAELVEHSRRLIKNGVSVVALSMGARGLLLVTAADAHHVSPPAVDVQSTIGSGDSVVAGIIHGLNAEHSLVDAARLGAACGAATAMTPGTELCRLDDVQALLPQVSLERVE